MKSKTEQANHTQWLWRYRSHLAMALIVVVAAVLWLALGVSRADVRNEASSQSQAIPVSVMQVRAQTLPYKPRYLGKSEAFQTVEIRSRVRGFLHERLFQEGGNVTSGDVLFRIDPKPFEAGVEIARARVESARARFVQAERQVSRYRGLYDQGAATASELEEWETTQQVAASDIELYEAQLVQAELDLGYTTVTSPIHGVIGRSLKDVGTYVDDGSNSLLAVVEQIDPLYVRFSISESEVLRTRRMRRDGRLTGPVEEEAKVRITLRDGSDFEHKGQISFIDVAVDDTTSTIMVRATVPNPERTLRPGQFLHVTMLALERPSMILVPKQAVVQTPASASVYVVAEGGETIEVRPVRLGDWHGNGWIIEEGLEDGEVIVVDNLMRLRRSSRILIESERMIEDFEVEDAPPLATEPPSLHVTQ